MCRKSRPSCVTSFPCAWRAPPERTPIRRVRRRGPKPTGRTPAAYYLVMAIDRTAQAGMAVWGVLVFCHLGLPAAAHASTQTSPEDEATEPRRPPARTLRQSIERRLTQLEPMPSEPNSEAAKEGALSGVPRFETSIEVLSTTPEAAAARFLEGADLVEGQAPAGAPTRRETQEYRPRTSPSIPLGGVLWLLNRAREAMVGGPRRPAPRYYVYEVTTARGIWPLLRETPLPPEIQRTPGVTIRLVGEYPDLAAARQACAGVGGGATVSVPPPAESPMPRQSE